MLSCPDRLLPLDEAMIGGMSLPCASDGEETEVCGKLSALDWILVEPVGRWYGVYCARHRTKSISNISEGLEETESDEEEEEEDETEEDIEIELDDKYLRRLDPKEWKDQDHYAVLGLKKVRHKATDAQIKKAYRKVVLAHHPDKRRSAGEKVNADADSDYFTCITKAYETLGNPVKRRSYDSVDPEFDDVVPPVNAHSREHFFEIFGELFVKNARWSTKKKGVPQLGDEKSTFEEVDSFYSFWYDFDSWREFSYLDEEEKEKGENREERRWIEKQNKQVRLKRKKEEMTRLRQLVDNAYSCDPRIQRFRDEEKQKKLDQKRAKQEAAKAKLEEEERKRQEIQEAERKAKEKEEEEARAQNEAAKKVKEATKKALKKERKTFRTYCEDHNYFAEDDSDLVNNMAELDKLCKLLSLETLETVNKAFEESTDVKARKAVFLQQVKEMNDQLEREKEELLMATQKTSSSGSSNGNSKPWSHDDLQLLVKAVNLFPAGTSKRWEVVADYMNQHTNNSNIKRTAKEVLERAKNMKKFEPGLKEEVNKQAYNKFEKAQKPVEVKDEPSISERFDSPAEQQGQNLSAWTADEQRLLEQALKTYPSSQADRWDRISECLPGRSKKDCMRRYKDLVEMVRAKKAVQDAKGKKN